MCSSIVWTASSAKPPSPTPTITQQLADVLKTLRFGVSPRSLGADLVLGKVSQLHDPLASPGRTLCGLSVTKRSLASIVLGLLGSLGYNSQVESSLAAQTKHLRASLLPLPKGALNSHTRPMQSSLASTFQPPVRVALAAIHPIMSLKPSISQSSWENELMCYELPLRGYACCYLGTVV